MSIIKNILGKREERCNFMYGYDQICTLPKGHKGDHFELPISKKR